MSTFFEIPHIETSPKRVRVLFAGKYIVDTRNGSLVYVHVS
jgi:uncharacterized protein (DUF427 family)